LGLEALSRGAQDALFVENAPAALAALRENILSLKAGARCRVLAADVFTFLAERAGELAGTTLVFADPPYGDQAERVAAQLAGVDAALWGARPIQVVECAKRQAMWPPARGWRRWPARAYGDTRIVIDERDATDGGSESA
jgi:16S rRNA (guanine966-N2)-methyltransferase